MSLRKEKVAIAIAKKRHEKNLKRLKLKKEHKNEPTDFQYRVLSKKYFSSFNKFIERKESVSDLKSFEGNSIVPEYFSFVKSFEETMLFFDKLNYFLYNSKGKVLLDFENCKHVSISAASFLQIVLLQYNRLEDKFNTSGYTKLLREIKTKRSKDIEVNKMLCALEIIGGMSDEEDVDDISYLPLGLKIFLKEKSSYRENKKGKTCNDIISFVNSSIQGLDFELNFRGQKSLSNLFSEILGNAEDHTKLNEYYVNGVSFKKKTSTEDSVVELNLTIINLGYSIYEGFQKTKKNNYKVIDKMNNFFDVHKNEMKFNGIKSNDGNFNEESLFTLYALQEGISRLKYVEDSRGNGTMNFIKAFMMLGEFGEENKKYESKLNVISGHTVIECTNKYKPYADGTNFVLSLNDVKDIKKLPDRKCIFVSKNYFPGTILQVKIHMNKKYFKKIIDG